jgi:hypothetical protein
MQHMRTPCLIWRGGTDARGRPRIWFEGRNLLATRVVLGPRGLTASRIQAAVHICRDRACIRPEHIVLCDLRSAQRLRGRGRSRLGPGDMSMFATLIGRREVCLREVSQAIGLRIQIVSAMAKQCVRWRKRRTKNCS